MAVGPAASSLWERVTAMNVSALEKMARQALNGEEISAESDSMLVGGAINAAEHRSLNSLSWQIAANVQASGSTSSTMTWAEPTRAWLSPGSNTVSKAYPERAWL